MDYVPKPQEETHGYYFQSGTWSVVCKWPVINVTLLTLKIATQNRRLMGYFIIILMKVLMKLHIMTL